MFKPKKENKLYDYIRMRNTYFIVHPSYYPNFLMQTSMPFQSQVTQHLIFIRIEEQGKNTNIICHLLEKKYQMFIYSSFNLENQPYKIIITTWSIVNSQLYTLLIIYRYYSCQRSIEKFSMSSNYTHLAENKVKGNVDIPIHKDIKTQS